MVVVMWVWAWEFADLLLELAPLALGLLATRLGLRHSGGWSTPGVRGNVRRAPCALGGHTYSKLCRVIRIVKFGEILLRPMERTGLAHDHANTQKAKKRRGYTHTSDFRSAPVLQPAQLDRPRAPSGPLEGHQGCLPGRSQPAATGSPYGPRRPNPAPECGSLTLQASHAQEPGGSRVVSANANDEPFTTTKKRWRQSHPGHEPTAMNAPAPCR